MTLPDVPEADYRQYESDQFGQQASRQIDQLGFEHAANQQIATLLQPISPEESLGRLGTGFSPAPQPPPPEPPPPPPPEPAPPPPEPVPPPETPPASPPVPAAPSPMAAPSAPPTSQPSPSDSGLSDWIGGALGAVQAAGGDINQFVQKFNPSGDPLGSALGAAQAAGADIGQFAQKLPPPPQPQPVAPSPSPSTPQTPPGGDLQSYARQAAQKAGIDPDVFVRQIQQESGFNPSAKSGAGAIGIAQFMPGTAQGMGVDPTDPYAALDAAAKLDAQHLQRYGGDWSRALAAYNAGPGAVDRYGGVPPFEETQRYVNTILQGQNPPPYTPSAQEGLARVGSGLDKGVYKDISQFGDNSLTADEAYAACGPAAAVRFAQRYGRNPTLREATDLAATVGWTPGSGMAGIASEQALLQKMDIPTKLTTDTAAMAREAQTGNPVTISTQGHYFYADGYDPNSGAFHVGRSGTDLRAGSEWMTLKQMEQVMGPVQGALLADNPQVPAPSTADHDTNPGSFLDRAKNTITDSLKNLGSTGQDILTALGQAGDNARANQASQLPGGAFNRLEPGAEGGPPSYTDFGKAAALSGPTSPGTALAPAARAAGQTVQQVAQDINDARGSSTLRDLASNPLMPSNALSGIERGLGDRIHEELSTNPIVQSDIRKALLPTIFDPGVPEQMQREQDLILSAQRKLLDDPRYQVTAEERQAMADFAMKVGGVEMPETSPGAIRALTSGASDLLPKLLGGTRGAAQDLAPLARTAIGEGGLGTPIYTSVPDTIGDAVAQRLREAAQADSTGVAHLTREEMAQLPGMANPNPPLNPKGEPLQWQIGHPPSLDDTRIAIDNGINQARWYSDFARNVAKLVGDDNVNEFRSLFGITSQQTPPTENLQYTLGLMQMARDFTEQGRSFSPDNIARWVADHPRVTSTGATGSWKMNMDQFRKVADLYNTGVVDVASNAKTSSYAQNVLSALRNRFDPNSTMDVWMQRLFNYRNAGTSAVSGSDPAFAAQRAVIAHLAGELGIVPHQAQAAAWFSIKAARDFADTAGAPASFKRMVNDYSTGGNTTLRDIIAEGRRLGVYDNPQGTWAHVVADRGVQDSIAKLVPGLDRERPAAADSAFLQYTGKTSKSYPVTPTTTAARLTEAEGQAPAVSATLGEDAARQLGYNPDTQQFDALGTVPHIVQANGEDVHVLVPGANIDALQYVGALVNKAAGADSMDIHIFRPEGTQLAGWKVVNPDSSVLAPEQLSQLQSALEAANVQYTAAPGGILRVHALPLGDPAYEAAVGQVTRDAGLKLERLAGVATSVGSENFEPILARFSDRYGGAGRSGLQAGERGFGGSQGGFANPRFAASLGGAAAGGVAGYQSDENAPLPERLGRAALGAAAGAAAGYGAGRLAEDLARTPTVERGLTQAERNRLPVASVQPAEIPTRPLPKGARPITSTTQEEIDRLGLHNYPEDLQATIANHAEGINWARDQRRGVIPDAEAARMGREYTGNVSLDQLIRAGGAGKAYTTEQIRALTNATAAQAVKVNDIARAIGRGDTSDRALRDWLLEGDKLDRLIQIGEGARAEAGRSLRAYQDPASLVNLAPGDAVSTISKLIGKDRKQLLGAITEYNRLVESGANPVQLANFWSGLKNPVTWTDWFKALRYNSMLSGPRTFEANAVGNAVELPWRLARDSGASILKGRPGEIVPEVTGAWAGLDQANRRFMEMLTQGITSEGVARGDLPRSIAARLQSSPGVAGQVQRGVARTLEAPGRVMAGMDEWAKAIAYGMSLGREAATTATKEGLRGDAWKTRVSQIMADPTIVPDVMRAADQMSDRMVFHGDMGGFGQGLAYLTQKMGPIGNIVLPFLKTSYHITARGIDTSPLGLLGTGIDVARGKYGRGSQLREALSSGLGPSSGVAPLGERLGDNLIGSMVWLAMLKQAGDGNISGSGPDDPQKKALLQSEGWQPNSIRIGDQWLSYANWGRAAIPLSLAAAAIESQKYAKPGTDTGTLIMDGARRTAAVVQNQTYLQSIGAAWKGMEDPARYGYNWVNQTVGSFIPYGSTINTVGQAMDPYARRADRWDIGDAIRSRLPPETPLIGGREQVPATQDVLGRPMPNPRQGLQALNPTQTSPIRDSPVLAELDRVGLAPPGPPTSISRLNQPIQLTPDEQRQIQEQAGGLIASRIAADIATPSYSKMTIEGQRRRLQQIIDLARTQAENQFLQSLPDATLRQRRAEGAIRRQPVPVSGT